MAVQVPAFAKIFTPDRVINQIQTNVAATLSPVAQVPLNSGILLQNQALVAGSNTINHMLGRTLVGWFTTRVRGQVFVSDDQDNNPTPQNTLILVVASPVTVDLFVF